MNKSIYNMARPESEFNTHRVINKKLKLKSGEDLIE